MVTLFQYRRDIGMIDKQNTSKQRTSLTQKVVRDFLASAEYQDVISCNFITGLMVKKTQKGAAYRYRYSTPSGMRRVKTIGKVSEIKPDQAARLALELKSYIDPLEQAEQEKRAYIESKLKLEQRTLGNYLSGLYSKHQQRKRSGNDTLNMIANNFKHLLDKDMSLITVADIKSWQVMREETVKFPTILRAYGALKTMLNKAVDDGFLLVNPLPPKSPLERPHFEETDQHIDRKDKRRLLTSEELNCLFAGLEAFNDLKRHQRVGSIKRGNQLLDSFEGKRFTHWSIPLTYLAYYTGMRVGDLKAITWQSLNLNFKRLSYTPSKTRHHSDPITVILDLPDSIIELMNKWWEQKGKPESGLIFPSERINGQLDKHAHLKPWRKIKQLGGLPEGLDFYALRHHWISTLIQTENLLQVARMAGHKSTKMIESHYGHLAPDRTKGALMAFDVITQSKVGNTG